MNSIETAITVISRFSQWAERSVPDLVKRWVTADSLIRVESFESPGRVVGDESVVALKDYRGNGVSDYYTSIGPGGGATEEIEVEAEDAFSGVDLCLSGIATTDTVAVTGEFVAEDGDVSMDSVLLENHRGFDTGDSFEVHLSVDEPVTSVTIEVEVTGAGDGAASLAGLKSTLLSRATHRDFVRRDRPRVGLPVPVQYEATGTPIVIVSVDTLRYDTREQLQPLLSVLGETATVPTEPRTNGNWTPPSHGSMFTGVHPGEHKYVGVGDASEHPLHPDLVTLPELLSEAGYKCSALTSHARILPEAGFGRGCYRFRAQNMTNWLNRDNDARTAVDRVLQWVERDTLSDPSSHRLCYFLHVFDPHLPYIPDHPTAALESFDLAAIDAFQDRINDTAPEAHVSGSPDEGVDFDEDFLDTVTENYRESVTYTARQLRRLIDGLRTNGLFDDALIIVTGDHGELFGEHGLYGHESVHYTNVRPFMVVKPPRDADWEVPDTPNTIDFLPTVAKAVGEPIPDQCQGTPWQEPDRDSTVRITERIRPKSYSVAVETGNGVFAVLRYPDRYPERPGSAELEAGPVSEEYYLLEDLRAGRYDECGDRLEDSTKEDIRKQAETFVAEKPVLARDSERSVRASEETAEQLRHLGYK
jgi:hypothetical protein